MEQSQSSFLELTLRTDVRG